MRIPAQRVAVKASRGWVVALVLACHGFLASAARADEGGVSFWLPGLVGSFAAVPTDPGFSVPVVYNHTSARAGASKNFIIGGNLTAGVDATADLLFFDPTTRSGSQSLVDRRP